MDRPVRYLPSVSALAATCLLAWSLGLPIGAQASAVATSDTSQSSVALAPSETTEKQPDLPDAGSRSTTSPATVTVTEEISLGTSSSSSSSTTNSTLVTPTTTLPSSSCAQPISSGPEPSATDCLFILRVATALETCAPACACAPKGTLPTSATDALVCLKRTTGQNIALQCPCP